MERYYKILGIPNNSSKEVIKKAYHTKMKALHPDKIHGTPLEDTATFFATEINEAYNILTSQSRKDNTSPNQSNCKNQTNFIEEDIYIEGKGLLKYTISNNFNVISDAVIRRAGISIPYNEDDIFWKRNPYLSENVKFSMNKHKMNYSMTIYTLGTKKYIALNQKIGDSWCYAGYEIISKPKNTSAKTETYYKPNNYTSHSNYSKQKSPIGTIVKIIIAIIAFGFIFQQLNTSSSPENRTQIFNTRSAAVYATVKSCDWLNVRSSPSSVNRNNIIEAISVNTRVEILEQANNGWVRIRYNNGKTGYVHGNYLSQ